MTDEIDVKLAPTGLREKHADEIKHMAHTDDALLSHVLTLATTGATQISPALDGVSLEVKPSTPLSVARSWLGAPIASRVGVYELSSAPAANTASKMSDLLSQAEVADRIDDYGEDYGPKNMADPDGTPWTPQLHNGAHARNQIKLERNASDHSKYILTVVSNAHPQALQLIDAALDADADTTVGAFLASGAMSRINAFSDLQNKRIADRFAALTGLVDIVDRRHHPTELTATDDTGTAVSMLEPTHLARAGNIASCGHNRVLLTNNTIDVTNSIGTAVPLIQGGIDGTVLFRPNSANTAKFSLGSLLTDSQTLRTAPVAARTDGVVDLSPDEEEHLYKITHWPGKAANSAAGRPAIKASALQNDTNKACLSDTVLRHTGLSAANFTAERYNVLGIVRAV